MKLRPFQSTALNFVIQAYKTGKLSALLIMPAGTGKTVLSMAICEEFIETHHIDSLAYISTSHAMESAFSSILKISSASSKIVYSYQELSELIDKELIDSNKFKVLIFDDVIEENTESFEKIFDFFKAFKIGLSRATPANGNIFADGVTYTYSLDQAVADGYFISSQAAFYRHSFNNLYFQIDNFDTRKDWWAENVKLQLTKQINLLENESAEYLKAQDLILSGKVNTAEILELSHKKEQLDEFNKLMSDDAYFDSRVEESHGVEAVWQKFFETNRWIFGFGLNYIFNAPLDGKKLEQTVEGYSITGHGKRTDALLRTTGLIQTLCFGEIKTHRKSILKQSKQAYRPDSWAISEELAGGISQINKTIQKSLKNISTALSILDDDGFKKSDPIYLYKPKSFLIIGSLKEFLNSDGDIHEEKFSSFELFRRSISDIEIITFDELYERAYALVHKKWTT